MQYIPELQLKKQEDRRIKAGHLWIYSNEVDTSRTPLNQFKAGDLVKIINNRGEFLGTGYINPHTLICARILTTKNKQVIDADFFQQKISQALSLREKLFKEPFYRLVYSEGDYLPGLIIDRFYNTFVVQMSTAGMDRLQNYIIEALKNLFNNPNILAKNDLSARKLEGLSLEDCVLNGDAPEYLTVKENGITYHAPVFTGQKTGWFYDQRANRALLKEYVADKEVLDVCCYLGGFGISAAHYGAKHVTCVDASEQALKALKHNAELNNLGDKISTINDDAFEALKKLLEQGRAFDVIILDPPAFIKNRAQIKSGIQGYLRLHNLALQLLKPHGFLFSASCSMHLSYDDLVDVIRRASLQQQQSMPIIANLAQDIDHPVHPAIKETKYLKGVIAYLM